MLTEDTGLERTIALSGVALFGIGMVTGLWSTVALTGQVKLAIPQLALSAHVNALLGGLWLLGLAYTQRFLRYGDTGRRRLAWATAVPAWGNWLIMVVASILGVRGLEVTHDPANNAIVLALLLFVVLPSIGSTLAWAYGFRRRRD